MSTTDDLRRVVKADAKGETYRSPDETPKPEDAETILAIAALMADADGTLYPEECRAFRALATAVFEVTGAPPGDTDLEAYLPDDASRADELLREHASNLRNAASRALAYKVAIAIANADFAAHEKEWAVDEALVNALGFSPEQADALTAEVHEALAGDDEDQG